MMTQVNQITLSEEQHGYLKPFIALIAKRVKTKLIICFSFSTIKSSAKNVLSDTTQEEADIFGLLIITSKKKRLRAYIQNEINSQARYSRMVTLFHDLQYVRQQIADNDPFFYFNPF